MPLDAEPRPDAEIISRNGGQEGQWRTTGTSCRETSFTDVHELVYLFHSWQLLLEVETIPEILEPLRRMPGHLMPAMNEALADAQAQLESAQSGTEIALHFADTPEFGDLVRWGSEQLSDIEAAITDDEVHVTWRRALGLARELLDEILVQLDRAPAMD